MFGAGQERFDRIGERTEDPVETDAGQPDLRFGFVARRGDQHDRGVRGHDLTGVLGEAAPQPDVDRAAEVSGGEDHIVTGIQHDRAVGLGGEDLVDHEHGHADVVGEQFTELTVTVRGEREIQRRDRSDPG